MVAKAVNGKVAVTRDNPDCFTEKSELVYSQLA